MSTDTAPKLVPVTVFVPPPPDTHEIVPGRVPKEGENHLWFHLGDWNSITEAGEFDQYRILAFPKQRKRLLTPAELAGKWLRFKDGSASFIGAYGNNIFWLNGASQGQTVKQCHAKGDTYSDTPTGERKSLEVDDKGGKL